MKKGNVRVSRFVSGIKISAIKEMAMRSAKVPGAASLTWGLPSFKTPAHIRRVVEQRLESDPEIGMYSLPYSLPDGLPELRETAAKAHSAATGIEVDPDRNVMITAGNMQGLNSLFHVLVNPGDEIIVTDPGFSSHFQQIRLCGGEPVFWKMDESLGWRLDVESLPGLITDRTKAIVLVSPSNPTGKIFSEAELRRVGEIALERDVLILLDDPYCHFTYENRDRYFNLASWPRCPS
jgi:aspartate/methionine/tyrosine aminotransferase